MAEPWNKAAANGVLGEARVRAMLLDRFHVVTRSIDMDGADFLIQLRSSGRFTDLLAPRLGVVQAKFAQDDRTTHYLPTEYALDGRQPLTEFFVIVSVGHEDNVSTYFLTAADLATLPVTRQDGATFYRLSPSGRRRFRQTKVKPILDAMERSLETRTDEQNERLLRTIHVPDYEFLRRSLASEWLLPVPNEHGFIPDLVYQLRSGLRAHLYSFDDFLLNVQKLLTTDDAIKCLEAVEEVLDEYGIEDEDSEVRLIRDMTRAAMLRNELASAIEIHNRRIAKLKRRGHWTRFLELFAKLFEAHASFHERHQVPVLISINATTKRLSDDHVRTTVTLAPGTRDVLAVATKLVSARTSSCAKKDQLVRSRELWRYGFEGGATTWRELHRLQAELLGDYYRLLFPKEPVGPLKLPVYLAE